MLLIELEGICGSGKSTQAELLADHLRTLVPPHTAVIVPELAVTDFGTHLLRLLHSNTPRASIAEAYAFFALEAEFHENFMKLERTLPNHVIIRDGGRGTLASYLYHANPGLSLEFLDAAFEHTSQHTIPALSIFIDIPIGTATQRNVRREKHSKFDMLPGKFLFNQRKILRELAATTLNWISIDGTKSKEEVFMQIRDQVLYTTISGS